MNTSNLIRSKTIRVDDLFDIEGILSKLFNTKTYYETEEDNDFILNDVKNEILVLQHKRLDMIASLMIKYINEELNDEESLDFGFTVIKFLHDVIDHKLYLLEMEDDNEMKNDFDDMKAKKVCDGNVKKFNISKTVSDLKSQMKGIHCNVIKEALVGINSNNAEIFTNHILFEKIVEFAKGYIRVYIMNLRDIEEIKRRIHIVPHLIKVKKNPWVEPCFDEHCFCDESQVYTKQDDGSFPKTKTIKFVNNVIKNRKLNEAFNEAFD